MSSLSSLASFLSSSYSRQKPNPFIYVLYYYFLLEYHCLIWLYSEENQLYVYIHPLPLGSLSHSVGILLSFRSSQSIELSSLRYTAGLHKLSILHMVLYLCQA